MKKLLKVLIIASALLQSSEIKLQCAKPLDNKRSSVDFYKACIDDFVRKHEQEREKQTQAINYAIDEWNEFVAIQNGTKKKSRVVTGSQGVAQGGSHTVGHKDPYKLSTGFKF